MDYFGGEKKSRKSKKKEKELKNLEKLVFGDPSHLFKEDEPSPAKKIKRSRKSVQEIDNETTLDNEINEEPKAVWEDEDDISTSIRMAHELQGRPDINHPGEPKDRYENLLRKRFENILGTPKWADLNNKGGNESCDSDNEDDDQILTRCGNFIEKSNKLKNGSLKFTSLKDLNSQTRREGKVIKAIEFHPLSTVALVAGFSGKATLFEVNGKDNPKIQMVKFPSFDICCAKFTSDGEQFVVGSKFHRNYYFYDMISGRSILVPSHHESGITNMENFEISPDGKTMAACGRFGMIYLIDVKSKECFSTLTMNDNVNAISFNSDGSRLYSHGDEGQVYVWDIKSRTCLHKFFDDGCLKGTSICVSPNERLLACGSNSGVVNLYDVNSLNNSNNPQPLKILLNLTTAATSLKFNHSSQLLAMASVKKDKSFKLVHYPSMSVYKNFPDPNKNTGCINCVSFSPNSGFIAAGSNANGKALLYRLNYFGSY